MTQKCCGVDTASVTYPSMLYLLAKAIDPATAHLTTHSSLLLLYSFILIFHVVNIVKEIIGNSDEHDHFSFHNLGF